MTHEEVLDEINVVYERISHSEDFVDGNYTEALEILIDFYETGLIEELKKIKTEMEEQSNRNFYENGWWTYVSSVFDKHISELKGE